MPHHCHFINGQWIAGDADAPAFESHQPATDEVVWSGHVATKAQIQDAVSAARAALPDWADTALEQRIKLLNNYQQQLESHKEQLIETICRDTGKPRWESATEVGAMIGKMGLTIDAWHERRATVTQQMKGAVAATRYKPHGVVAVFGPFNLPGHLPNGHIAPALLAGNTIVFKPSEQTPAVGQLITELWHEAGLPVGVLNMIQGARDTGIALSGHVEIDGIYFTGGCAAGLGLHRALALTPQKILALEMGGNNPLIVHYASDLDAAAYMTIQSAYITAGQRCTCARRLIVPQGRKGNNFVDRLAEMIAKVRVGLFTLEPEPFMGPLINDATAHHLLDAQQQLQQAGGSSLVEMKSLANRPALLTPGLIDVTAVPDRTDAELFGPLLQLIRVKDFGAAIAEANNTRYGLSAALLSDDRHMWEQFYRYIRAGVVNWNRQTTGASGRMPFGGVGISGNHRPSGYFAADYCSYPVASIEAEDLVLPDQLSPGITL